VEPTPSSPDPRDEHALAKTLHSLRTPLTVIKGHSQLLGRWLRRLNVPEAEAALARLAAIEQAVAALDTRLRELEARLEASVGQSGEETP
jgi:signal transduction histidine kinase